MIPIQTVNLQAYPVLADVISIVSYHILKETNLNIAMTMHLPSWRTGLKQINIQNLTLCVTSNKIYLY